MTYPMHYGATTVKMGFGDSLVNLVSGLGTEKDATTQATYGYNLLPKEQVETAYRFNWVARKGIDIPPYDMTREWRAWQAKKEQIAAIEDVEKNLGIQRKVRQGMVLARLYGGSALVMGIDNDAQAEQELDLGRVGKDALKFVHVLNRYEITAGQCRDDPRDPWYGEPEFYERRTFTVKNPAAGVRIHPSRVIRFDGASIPDKNLSQDGWGDSMIQVLDEAIKHVGLVTGGVASLINDAKVDVLSIPNLTQNITTQAYKDRLTTRLTYASTMKSMVNMLVIDGAEKWERINNQFAGLPDLIKLYLLMASGAWDIPATRFLGQSPVGMNATGESDLTNYYDGLSSKQNSDVSPALHRLDEVIIRSALGNRPEEIHYRWNPLWQLDPVAQATRQKTLAETLQIDTLVGLVSPDALRKGRENQLIEEGTYPGIEDAIKETEGDDSHMALTPEEEAQQAADLAKQQAALQAEANAQVPPARRGKAANDAVSDALALVDDWNEEDHPRNKVGEFATSGGGGSSSESSGAGTTTHAALEKEHGKPVMKENGLTGYAQGDHGKKGALPNGKEYTKVDIKLVRGKETVRTFGTIKSVVVRETDTLPGQKYVASHTDVVKYRVKTDESAGIKGTDHKTLAAAKQRASFEIDLRRARIKKEKAAAGGAATDALTDAAPRTMYVYRKVTNVRAIRAWAKKQGIKTILPDLHVTIAFSREPVDWIKMGQDGQWADGEGKGTFTIGAGGPRVVERLKGTALALVFSANRLIWRHQDMIYKGASWDYDDFQPHITITYNQQELDLDTIEPYTGQIDLGPELFEEIDFEREDPQEVAA